MTLYEFLNKLDETKIFYKLSRINEDTIMVEVAVPGQRWEVEFFEDGEVRIEKFLSNGEIFDESEVELLFDKYGE